LRASSIQVLVQPLFYFTLFTTLKTSYFNVVLLFAGKLLQFSGPGKHRAQDPRMDIAN